MLTANEVLEDDETHVGSYNAEIARWRDDQWISTIPPIFVIVSDQRVIIQAQSRKHHEPAVIPSRYIKSVTKIESGRRHGVLVCLKTDHYIGMLVAGDPEFTLLENLRTLMHSQKGRFKHHLDLSGIQKLINFFSKLD